MINYIIRKNNLNFIRRNARKSIGKDLEQSKKMENYVERVKDKKESDVGILRANEMHWAQEETAKQSEAHLHRDHGKNIHLSSIPG